MKIIDILIKIFSCPWVYISYIAAFLIGFFFCPWKNISELLIGCLLVPCYIPIVKIIIRAEKENLNKRTPKE
jgi:hypothetical protein